MNVDKVDILNILDSQITALYMCAWNKKRKVAHWLSVFNIVIFYFDKLWYDSLNSPVKNIEYFWKDCVSYQWVC